VSPSRDAIVARLTSFYKQSPIKLLEQRHERTIALFKFRARVAARPL